MHYTRPIYNVILPSKTIVIPSFVFNLRHCKMLLLSVSLPQLSVSHTSEWIACRMLQCRDVAHGALVGNIYIEWSTESPGSSFQLQMLLKLLSFWCQLLNGVSLAKIWHGICRKATAPPCLLTPTIFGGTEFHRVPSPLQHWIWVSPSLNCPMCLLPSCPLQRSSFVAVRRRQLRVAIGSGLDERLSTKLMEFGLTQHVVTPPTHGDRLLDVV